MDEDEIEVECTIRPIRWHWSLLGTIAVGFVAGVFEAAATASRDVEIGIAAHVVYQLSRDDFAAEAAMAIETLTVVE